MILRRSRHLQIIELAVQERCGKEVPELGGEPGRVCVMTGIQEPEASGGTPVREHPR
jgi:hypothetical protein